MIKRIYLPVIALFLLTISCTKKNAADGTPGATDDTKVTINEIAYPTVTIGNQIWTAVNYRGPGGRAVGIAYDESIYGRFYSMSELSNIKLPNGWRIPTHDDFKKLLSAFPNVTLIGSEAYGDSNTSVSLRSANGWSTKAGTNDSKFNAYAAGYFNDANQAIFVQNDAAAFYSSTVNPLDGSNYSLIIYDYSPYANNLYCIMGTLPQTVKMSLRFVKDK